MTVDERIAYLELQVVALRQAVRLLVDHVRDDGRARALDPAGELLVIADAEVDRAEWWEPGEEGGRAT